MARTHSTYTVDTAPAEPLPGTPARETFPAHRLGWEPYLGRYADTTTGHVYELVRYSPSPEAAWLDAYGLAQREGATVLSVAWTWYVA